MLGDHQAEHQNGGTNLELTCRKIPRGSETIHTAGEASFELMSRNVSNIVKEEMASSVSQALRRLRDRSPKHGNSAMQEVWIQLNNIEHI